ncbi:hypothetical protein F4810DRAFT_718465 [Camillea tinctor]|nr:hypothetical protein F4810DRAFT_718465 [Camillea tinctor]
MTRFYENVLILTASTSTLALGTGWPNSGTQSGQVHVYSWSEASKVGCLTADGQWAASGPCDTFTSEALGEVIVDRSWTQLEIRNSAGAKCWFPDGNTLELVCGESIGDTLWLHASDYKADILVHSRAIDSYVPLDGTVPTGEKVVPLKSEGQTQDGNNYQLIWVAQ